MNGDPRKSWETLFQRALELIDSVPNLRPPDWSFGGGTVLMRRHRHRISKDVDIFVGDPQILGYLSPRLNDAAEALTADYDEQASFLKLYVQEGEIDFVVAGPLTQSPYVVESLFDHSVQVESSAEIIAKKVWHRGLEFTARDVFDLALVSEFESEALHEIQPILRERRDAILQRIATHDATMREAFAGLEVLDYRRTFDECASIVRKCLEAA